MDEAAMNGNRDNDVARQTPHSPIHPWMEFAGMFKDDPWIDDWKQSIEEYRQQVDDDPDAL
jgi:hypothetical protein